MRIPPDTFETTYFSSLSEELARRAARATLSQVSPASPALRQELERLIGSAPGEPGSFLADPVFEATFGWEPADTRMRDLSPDLVLPKLRNAMDAPPNEYAAQRFGADWYPHRHQVESWRALKREPPQSVVVTSGTGSGKTECFAVPILDALAREAVLQGRLSGVRALFLYPLNALINSQRDRLSAWTRAFGGRIRYCLYNGETPERGRPNDRHIRPEQVTNRADLRKDPPPILVTNATMLEYMLVRTKDRPIIKASRGLLRTIVLDEAHTYVGSQAAELSLLLRRVLHAFGVGAGDVRFVATSATIANSDGGDTTEELRRYLADLAGVTPDRVEVVRGARKVPCLPREFDKRQEDLPTLDELDGLTPQTRFSRLASVPCIRRLRDRLAKGPARAGESASVLFDRDEDDVDAESRARAVALLDRCRSAVHSARDGETIPLLPLRGHLFHRTQAGLWACVNPKCPARQGTPLDSATWPFGQVFLEHREQCPACDSLVFEMVVCATCGAEYLAAEEETDGGVRALRPAHGTPSDPLDAMESNDLDLEEEAETDQEEKPDRNKPARHRIVRRRLITARRAALHDWHHAAVDPRTGFIGDAEDAVRVGIILPDDDERLVCDRCRTREREPEAVFRPVRTGRAFYLGVAIPTLLEHAPPALRDDNRADRDLPFWGRRTLTFSDSRQGSARFAAKTEQEAERNWVRSWVYHQLWAEAERKSGFAGDSTSKLVSEIEQLRPLAAGNSIIQGILEQKESELATSQQPAQGRLSWEQLEERLAGTQEVRWMIQQWADRGYRDLTERDAARFCLYREFIRRSKRQSSLETLGLARLRYPRLEEPKQPPPEWRQKGRSGEEWRIFLSVAMDHMVRGYTAVQVDELYLRWMGVRIRPTVLMPPDWDDRERGVVRWPRVSKRAAANSRIPQLGRLLFRFLSLSVDDVEDRATVNALLGAAWTSVRSLLTGGARGYALDMKEPGTVEFETVEHAWLCPITRRMLPRTLGGLTPYADLTHTSDLWQATGIEMPKLGYPFGRSDGHEVLPRELHEWLESDETIRTARDAGAWTEFGDRIALFVDYLRTAEHSAQLTGQRLRKLERSFKKGTTNLLSCSTTMEMGVDIGGLSTIAMNNAPPGPANFLQRAGRAGRRGETAASSLTMCGSVPHGEAVYHDPMWPFATPIHVPRVSLESERIVERHIDSLLLTRFLDRDAPDVLRLQSGWFFLPADGALAPAQRFDNWLRGAECRRDAWVTAGLKRLVARSCLAGVSVERLLDGVQTRLMHVFGEWNAELALMEQEMRLALEEKPDDEETTPALLAIARQRERLTGEYLLKDLVSRGFLPGYGFPTGVLPFIHTTIEALEREKKEPERRKKRMAEGGAADGREDSFARGRGYPTRDIAMAIREYAPGSEIVVDGLVYRSKGVSLNWHMPPSDEAPFKETQAFRTAWRCKHCGAVGTATSRPEGCGECGEATGRLEFIEYLEPSGFAVEIFARPDNDLSRRQYVPVVPSWISASGAPWTALPGLGRYRHDPDGRIFRRNAGLHGEGYAICLRCGRAVSESEDPRRSEIPDELAEHYPLRGGKNRDENGRCWGSGRTRAIKRGQWLGKEAKTDVFELQLANPTTGAGLGDLTVATSIAVALRQALARRLGIDAREVGFSAETRYDAQQGTRTSILLYDAAAGGAGYVGLATDLLPQLLRDARSLLECPAKCDRACHGCLLTFDSQFEIERLDRNRALEMLSDDYLAPLDARPSDCKLPGDAAVEFRPLSNALERESARPESEELRVYLDGTGAEWDVVEWPLRRLLVARAADGRTVALVAPRSRVEEIPDDVAAPLASLLEGGCLKLQLLDAEAWNALPSGLVAEVAGGQRTIRWSVGPEGCRRPGPEWGTPEADTMVVRTVSGSAPAKLPGEAQEPALLRPKVAPGFREVTVRRQFEDRPLRQFGKRFWELICSECPEFSRQLQKGIRISEVFYVDRYARAPIHARLLAEVLGALLPPNGAAGLDRETQVVLQTQSLSSRDTRSPHAVSHDWRYEDDRRETLAALFRMRDLPEPNLQVKDRPGVQHGRELELVWEDGSSVSIRLDQGLGFLELKGWHPHPFGAMPEQQAKALNETDGRLRKRDRTPVTLYVKLERA